MAHHRLIKVTRRTALSVALGLCFASGAYAQSNTAGAVFGQATAGDMIVIENPAIGFRREITVSANGSFRVPGLSPGSYRVTARRADGSTQTQSITVSVGTGTSVDFAAADDATTLAAVEVVGSTINPIDISSVESTTVLTAERIARIPVPRDITSVALLAPGTTLGDSDFDSAGFGNRLASFGGSSVAENAYFVNGFNVTNSFKGLNFAQLPFEAIAEQQIKTGGYGAEFGRSLGGVVNVITKRGTNEFHAGGNIFWTPEFLSETNPDQVRRNGEVIADNSKDKGWEAIASVWASGPLIKDVLFGYALLQYGREDRDVSPAAIGGNVFPASPNDINTAIESPLWLVKLDWNINDSNLLEFTAFSDNQEAERDHFRVSFGGESGIEPIRGDFLGTEFLEQGGENYVLKYTGYLTDTFTLSALYGHSSFSRSASSIDANGRNEFFGDLVGDISGCPVIQDQRTAVTDGDIPARVGCSLGDVLTRADAEDTRDQYRIDAEWQLGDHLLRFGYDADTFETVDGAANSGGEIWQYQTFAGEEVVRQQITRTGSTVEVDSTAFYIEDSWNITDNFIGYLGLRWDTFENKNGAGEVYVEQKDQFGPRLGFSWDVNGDSTLKIFGNAGRYALPLTATVAIRGASASLFTRQHFDFTGVDPVTGAPLDPTPIPLDDPRCRVNGGGLECAVQFVNNEFGEAKSANTIASRNLDPQYQDEYILGFQKQLTDAFSLGVRGIYRDLKRAIDDTCDYRPFVQFAEDNGLEFNPQNPNFPYCHLFNPGQDLDVLIDIDGDGTLENVVIPGDQISPEAKRNYFAIETFFEGHWDRFFLQGSYTYAKSYGNFEGGVKSDIGQDDTNITQDFDYPELTVGANGYLPNDRRHTIKVFGNYELTEEWSIGANLLIQSGRPINCFGIFANEPVNYDNSFFSCDAGVPGDLNGNGEVEEDLGEPLTQDNGSTVVPRGSAGRTPWIYTIDLSVAYRPAAIEGLQFKVDVFNLFNGQRATEVSEFGEDDGGIPLTDSSFQQPTAWQEPRSVRFLVQYDF